MNVDPVFERVRARWLFVILMLDIIAYNIFQSLSGAWLRVEHRRKHRCWSAHAAQPLPTQPLLRGRGQANRRTHRTAPLVLSASCLNRTVTHHRPATLRFLHRGAFIGCLDTILRCAILTPMYEEFIFRGLLVLVYRWTKKRGLMKAVVISSLIFGVLHIQWFGFRLEPY